MRYDIEVSTSYKDKTFTVKIEDVEFFKEIVNDIMDGNSSGDVLEFKATDSYGFLDCTITYRLNMGAEVETIVKNRLQPISTEDVSGQIATMKTIGLTPIAYDGETLIGQDGDELCLLKNGKTLDREKLAEGKSFHKYGFYVLESNGDFVINPIGNNDPALLCEYIYERIAYAELSQFDWIDKTNQLDEMEDEITKGAEFLDSQFRFIK
ncbi:MAG: hypothetical protein IJ955_02090 [Oscillospiraceae bacterium]|nr:hypothetical protein [Oscillospiraceae bacterium]